MGDGAWLDSSASGGRRKSYNASQGDMVAASEKRMDRRDIIAKSAEAGEMIAQTKERLMDLDLSDR